MKDNNKLTTVEDMAVAIKKLKIAFKDYPDDFFALMAERIVDNKITGYQLEKGVDRIIDTLQGKYLSIADVIISCKERKLLVKYKCGKQELETTERAYEDNKKADTGNEYTKVEFIGYVHQ